MFSRSKISDFSSLPEKTIEVFIYILILLILGYWLKDFFKMSWQYGLIQFLLPYSMLSYIVVIIAGAYYGVLIVTLIRDDFKRIQGALLLIISIYITFYYSRFFYDNFLFFIVSFGSVSLYAYKKIEPSSCIYKYKNELLTLISRLTILLIIISVLSYFGGYFQTYQTFPEASAYYLVFTGIFIFVFHNFMKHEVSQNDVFVIGPPRIGKTVFMSALCNITNGDSNPPLHEACDKMLYQKKWPESTTKLDELEFTFPKGFLFTKCMTISTYDYPGSYAFDELQTVFKWLYMKKKEGNYSSFKELVLKYLFSWDDIPGNHNGRLVEFLKQEFDVEWIKTAKIEKTDGGRTIEVYTEENYLSLKLEKTEVNLRIDDGTTFKFIAKRENDKLNIYVSNINIREELSLGTIEDIEKIIYKIATSSKLIFLISANSINGEDEDMRTPTQTPTGTPTVQDIAKWQGRLEEYIGMYQLFASVIDKSFIVVVTKIDRAYEINIQDGISLDEVSNRVLSDLRNISILNNRRVTRPSLPVFPCWVEEDNGKPKIENGGVVAVGYHDIIKRL